MISHQLQIFWLMFFSIYPSFIGKKVVISETFSLFLSSDLIIQLTEDKSYGRPFRKFELLNIFLACYFRDL